MLHALDKTARILLTGFAFLYFGVGSVLMGWVFLPVSRLLGGTPEQKAVRCRKVTAWGLLTFVWVLNLGRLTVFRYRDFKPQPPAGPYVLVANHPTLIDITLLFCVYEDLVNIVKARLFKTPIVGPLLRHCEHIEAGDGSATAGAAVMQRALDTLAAGHPIMLFPEGTRSPFRSLRHFHRGACEIACRAGVPILPVFITCEPPTLMKGVPWYEVPDRSANIEMRQLPLIETRDWDGNARALNRHLEQVYATELAAHKARIGVSETNSPSEATGVRGDAAEPPPSRETFPQTLPQPNAGPR